MNRLICFIAICFFFSCQKERAEAEIPTFVSIADVAMDFLPNQGSEHQMITEVWAYVDSQLIGAYPVPGEFPVIAEDVFQLDLFAGIRENGQALSPRLYPFFPPFSSTLTPSQGQSLSVNPVYQYNSRTVFAHIEDFENGHRLDDDLDGDAETSVSINSGMDAIEGRSGVMTLTSAHPTCEVGTDQIFETIPTDGSVVVLEFEYRSDVPLSVGLRGHSGSTAASQYKLLLFPSSEVTKVYVNFSPDLQASQLKGYQLIFLATFDVGMSASIQYVYLDNLKLLHF